MQIDEPGKADCTKAFRQGGALNERCLEWLLGGAKSVLWNVIGRSQGKDAVDDLAQASIIHAWKNRDRFRGDSSLAGWVAGIAKNVGLMHLRRGVTKRETIEWNEVNDNRHIDDTSREVEGRILIGLINANLTKREALVCRLILKGYSQEEVGLELNMQENAVKMTMRRVREKVTKLLNDIQSEDSRLDAHRKPDRTNASGKDR